MNAKINKIIYNKKVLIYKMTFIYFIFLYSKEIKIDSRLMAILLSCLSTYFDSVNKYGIILRNRCQVKIGSAIKLSLFEIVIN